MAVDMTGKRVLVLGMARSGIGAATLIHRLGGHALVSDRKSFDTLTSAIEELRKIGADVETGSHHRAETEAFNLVVLSPGVVPPEPLERSWRNRGIPVWSELELAARVFPGRWIGVTGSNGKTTTVNLITGILKEAGLKAAMAGNVGTAWSGYLPAASDSVFVVEVSSFQLEHVERLRPNVGVLLNLYENHLDRHGTMEVYAELKTRLFANQTSEDKAVLNGDDERVQHLAEKMRGRIVRFGRDSRSEFGMREDELVFRKGGIEKSIVHRSEFPLRGRHNEMNALAAAAAAFNFGVSLDTIGRGLRQARPVEHRIEFVVSQNGIDYFNDSKSTNMIATMTALDSFERNVILLFGGRPKKESFAPLMERFPKPIKRLVVFGEAVAKLRDELPQKLPIEEARDIEEALAAARRIAEPGDTILLSPGCTSFDQFNNFEERGRTFKALVSA
ncbi:UDP-N-acetylmuramoyl-L-alanine--D-glutamate ligase [candidate division KSB1 bacterium]|nr:MAG: UDP-N-acetylmuramoyl-L-alanine--D-glutamate ligase [candidate division KSB1 bacterium]